MSIAPVVTDLTVRNHLRSSFQTTQLLTLNGIGSTRPELEQALVVHTGAQFSGQVAAGAVEVSGDATVLGLLVGAEYGPMAAASLDVTGIVSAAGAATDLFAYQYYVAPVGDDVHGNGTITDPYQTVAKAMAAAQADPAPVLKTIVLLAGTYTGNVLVQSCLSLTSSSGAVIVGNVRVDVLTEGTVTLQGLTILGSVLDQASSAPIAAHNLVLQDCTVHCTVASEEVLSVFTAAAVRVNGCTIRAILAAPTEAPVLSFSTDVVVTLRDSWIYLAAPSVAVGEKVMLLDQAGPGSMDGCVFTALIDSANVARLRKLVRLASGASHTVRGCSFNFTAGTVLDGPGGDLAALYLGSGSTLYLLQNTFGVSSSGGYISGEAVRNAGGTVYTQGNVPLAGSLTGIVGSFTELTPY